ncbi:MAG TPA: pyridoxamine 5'-phosphate oxidase family protein [Candidatus Baltobacteraceae bacterium]|nr:pyridoxamine 5'-phosphate oxidase family protein [Candidatus Baltobacteraceae bacterium]
MRRTDREITDPAEIRAILEKADACHLALAENNVPYLVTMNFGLKRDPSLVLYFHAAHAGKKVEMLKKNNRVCFGADIDHELLLSETGTSCGCSMRFRSVIGTGQISFITNRAEKGEALAAIMQHYAAHAAARFTEEMIERTTILRLDVTEITGKRRA